MPSGTVHGIPIKVLIADDHPVVRNGLRAALAAEPDIIVVGEARDGIELEEQAAKYKPDVIVMDIYMPRRTGLEALPLIKQQLPQVKVLVLSVSEYQDDLVQAVRFGADGYLLKKSEITEVIDAIKRVSAGEAILSSRMTALAMSELRDKKGVPDLTTREQEVLDLFTKGLTAVEISHRLSISTGTVSTYTYRIIQKLHLKNKAEAIAYAIRRQSRKGTF